SYMLNIRSVACPNCPVQSETHVEEIVIMPKRKKKLKQIKDSRKLKKLADELLNEKAEQQFHININLNNTQTTPCIRLQIFDSYNSNQCNFIAVCRFFLKKLSWHSHTQTTS
ncbi:15012_t:CDS:1, partial [Racocetra persica]